MASHMVSGYIGYKCLGGTTYQITFYNYANTCNEAYDQDTLTMWFGDGTHQVVARVNGPDSGGFPDGVPVCNCRKICLYQTTHTYPGQGTYRIYVDDPARMASITNMLNSANEDFFIYSTINLNGFTGDSIVAPVVTNPLACVYACENECYYFNMGAYSPTGDSISYSLGNCLGTGGGTAAGYYIPSGATIDPVSGTLAWCSPPTMNPNSSGIYNFAIYLVCYKRVYIGGRTEQVPVDTMECEVEVLEQQCNTIAPFVIGPSDTCIVAGDLLKLNYRANDADINSAVSVIATGEPFVTSPPATTNSPAPANPVNLIFTWQTNCTEVRRNAYPLVVTATYSPLFSPPLNGYQATSIYIVGPAPTNLTATPIGSSIQLNWNPSTCPQVTGYEVYRHIGCYKWIHGACETGVPSYTGYTLIGTTTCPSPTCTSFLDNNGGSGLTPGVSYDYMVVAKYPLPDGSLSYASNDTCIKIRRDMPIITNVSIDSTDMSHGRIYVRWTKPKTDSSDLDTIANPGPYTYKIMRAGGISGSSFSLVTSFTAPYFKAPIDTTYTDTALNTQTSGYNYRVDLYSNSNFVASSPTASSVYLSIHPDNNMLHLSWQSNIPWVDSTYMIYRTYPPPTHLIATVQGTQHTYTDSNLTNLKTYCYYVESKNYYADTTILHPLFDSSEIMCGVPKDTIPPCPPNLAITPECSIYKDSLVWDNPDYFCPKVDNRILYYEIYYNAIPNQEMQLLTTIYDLKDTTYIFDSTSSIAGCFNVIAVDSFGNRSPLNTICVDNCPEYELPNIFTPNGDGKYDLFTPVLPYRFIKSIDINIFNRWGQVMFHTIDPMINWDGKDKSTGMPCPDGVYYYVCQVNEIHLDGIQSRELKGFVQILR
jgi:gliding motility-associated-like protein